MKRKPAFVLIMPILLIAMAACSKKNPLITDTPADYYPLTVGKYIIYRMDSLKFINVGSQDTTISYLAKEVVDDTITDNLGRPSFRIIRYLNDTLASGDWVPSEAYMVTPTANSVEVVENNLRYIKLVTPVQDNISWDGNSYIDTKSADSQVPYMDGWNYTYANTGQPYDPLFGTVPEAVVVNEINQTTGNADTYLETTISQEVYGKGIGMIYRKFLHSEYQSPNTSNPAGATIGYGLTFNMVDHN
ncbi:MAG TPA: hypothetical protein VG890_08730 [Puia sp.]|nr:hypothetical protein [Puia sp.]